MFSRDKEIEYWPEVGYAFAGTEAVAQSCSIKKVFVKIQQNSQENTCVGVSYLRKLQA